MTKAEWRVGFVVLSDSFQATVRQLVAELGVCWWKPTPAPTAVVPTSWTTPAHPSTQPSPVMAPRPR